MIQEIGRKHYKQMNDFEKDFLKKILHERFKEKTSKNKYVANLNFTNHAIERMKKRYENKEISLYQIKTTLFNSKIVEYGLSIDEYNNITEKITLRSNYIFDNDKNVVLVYDYTNNVILTCWYINIKDTREDIDYSQYQLQQVLIRKDFEK